MTLMIISSVEVTDGKGQMIYVDSGESTLKLNRETGEARLNGRKLQFTNLIQERKGVVFVPAEILKELRGNEFQFSRNDPRG